MTSPNRERTKSTSRTAKVHASLQKDDQLHISETHRLIYHALVTKHGQAHADTWLRGEQSKGKTNLPTLKRASWLNVQNFSVATHEPKEEQKADNPQEQKHVSEASSSPISGLEAEGGTVTPSETLTGGLTLQEKISEQTQHLQSQLKPTGLNLLRVLLETGHEVAKARGYSPHVSCVTFFCPQEIIVKALGVVRSTVWRNLQDLKALDLLDASEWKTDLNGATCNGGYLWKVKLDPHSQSKPKLNIEEFKHPWRDLTADVMEGKTAFNTVHQSLPQEEIRYGVKSILTWALPPKPNKKPSLPVSSLTDAQGEKRVYSLESILDLPGVERSERNEMVKLTARAIGYCLGDTSVVSRHFYHRILWNLLRQYDQGNDWFGAFYNFASRVRTDFNERYAKKAGALLISRLKQWPLWQQLDTTPPYRVATGPLQTFMA